MNNVAEYPDSSWTRGINSLDDPTSLPSGQFQWAENILCRGGRIQTRPSFINRGRAATTYPRGFTVFQPTNKEPFIVAAFGGTIYTLAYPFTGTWKSLTSFWSADPSDTQIYFEVAIKGAVTNPDGTLSIVDPYKVLLMQNGYGRALYWDGVKPVGSLDPDANQTPIGKQMKWVANRLWVSTGNKIRVSNILDPFTFTEEDITAEGGYFTLPDECTGLAVTVDQKSLLAFTATTTTAFQAGIRQRNTWKDTTDFQKIILDNIGCIAPSTIVSQYGIIWWLSQGGLMRLDTALQTYRTSQVRYLDNNMIRSKANISDDMSRACAGWYDNFLVVSVPSGDIHNAHTWVMDQSPKQLLDESSSPIWASNWTGIRPVQWVTANIKGRSRCFALSADKPFASGTRLYEPNVWEAFCGTRQDIGKTVTGATSSKNIASSAEFKFLGYTEQYKDFAYAVLELAELAGSIHLDVYYASRHSGYKRVLSKNIVATTASLIANSPVTNVDSYIRQSRTIMTYGDDSESADLDPGVESKLTRNTDKAFALLIKWTGSLTIASIKLCTTPNEYHVETEEDEGFQRYVKPDGSGAVTVNVPIGSSLLQGRMSSNIRSVTPRWQEDNYNANT